MADQNVSNKHITAKYFTINRTLLSPQKAFSEIYTEQEASAIRRPGLAPLRSATEVRARK